MSRIAFSNGDAGLTVRAGLNANFAELYNFSLAAGAAISVTPSMSMAAIKSAIEAVSANSVIWFAPGTYAFGDTIIYPVTGTKLRCHPGTVTLNKTTTATGGFQKPYFDCIDVADVEFDGFTFSKDAASFRENAIYFRATSLGGTTNVVVRNCTFNRCGLWFERYVDGFLVENCTLSGHGTEDKGTFYGIATGGQVISGISQNNDGIVKNGTIRDCKFKNMQSEAIDINWDTWQVTIEGNYFEDNDCGPAGIGGTNEVIDVGGGDCRDIKVLNNFILQTAAAPNSTSGVHIKQGTLRAVVAGNVIRQETTPATPVDATRYNGIYIDKCAQALVERNDVSGFHRGFSAAGPVATLNVSNNKFRSSRLDEMLLAGTVSNPILDVRVTGNEIGDGLTTTEEAIDLEYVTRALISGNIMRGAGSQATIRVRAGCVDVSIVDNPRISQGRYGVLVEAGSKGTRVSRNGIINCQRNGVLFSGGASTNYFVQDNDIHNVNIEAGAYYAIEFEGAGGTVTGNTIWDTGADDTTKTTKNGINVSGTSDGCWYTGNKVRDVKSGGTNFNGLANLTNPVT